MKKKKTYNTNLHLIQKNELLKNLQNKIIEIDKNENPRGGFFEEITRININIKMKKIFGIIATTRYGNEYEAISETELVDEAFNFFLEKRFCLL